MYFSSPVSFDLSGLRRTFTLPPYFFPFLRAIPAIFRLQLVTVVAYLRGGCIQFSDWQNQLAQGGAANIRLGAMQSEQIHRNAKVLIPCICGVIVLGVLNSSFIPPRMTRMSRRLWLRLQFWVRELRETLKNQRWRIQKLSNAYSRAMLVKVRRFE